MKRFLLYSFVLVLATVSCSDDENSFDLTPSIGFTTTNGTLLENNVGGIRVGLHTNVSLKETVTATIAFTNFQNLVYGVDFTTEPELVNNTLTLTITPEDKNPSFFVYPTFNGKDRLLSFTISGVTGGDLTLAQPVARTYLLTIKSLGCPQGVQNISVSHNFDGCADFATPSGFTEVFEPGSKTDRGWGCRNFGLNSTRAVRASAVGGTAGNDNSWLIMNPVRVAAGSNVIIRFWVFSNFSGPGVVKVKWSSDYAGGSNPLTSTWTDISVINSQFPADGSKVWKEINVTLNDICGDNVYLAFAYNGGTNANSSSWDIEDLSVVVN
jgi:hypothetical protein